MKQYIKNTIILMFALLWGLSLTSCSDSEADYSDDSAYPPPTIEPTSPAEIDAVEYNSTVTVSARSFSDFGYHEFYTNVFARDH